MAGTLREDARGVVVLQKKEEKKKKDQLHMRVLNFTWVSGLPVRCARQPQVPAMKMKASSASGCAISM
jgi:hypothetical protein